MARGKILVVDDEMIVRRALADILQDEGYQVELAASGREGLERTASGNFDVALVDIRLPDLDGMQLLRSLREIDEDLKALIITGYPSLETATQAVRLGAFDYLLKPLGNERVLISVQNALAARHLALNNKQLLRDLQRANVELRRSNYELATAKEQLERNYDAQSVINSFLRLSLEDIPLDEFLKAACDLILSIPWLAFESRGCIFLVEDDAEILVMKAQSGLSEPMEKACARVPFGRCLCGWTALTQETQFADHLGDRHEIHYEGITPHGHYCVPILLAGRMLGVMNLYLKEGHRRDQTEEEFLTAVANTLAGVTERKKAEEAVTKHRRDLQGLSARLINAQEAERKRIAQELHDEMGQALTAMAIDLAAIEKELPSELALMTADRLAETRSLADQTLQQIRELALDLRPAMLDDLGVVPTLRWYVNRYARRLHIDVEFEAIDFEERLTPEVETVLYRVVQESLTNVARHAEANRVHVHLERKESTVAGFIEDDGKGFDIEEVVGREDPARGAGLLGIRERVASLRGSFSILSRPGEGTRLSFEIPIAE